MTDVGKTVGGPEGRSNGRIGQDVESGSRIGLHPLRVEQGTGRDSEARVQGPSEKHSAGPGRQSTHPRQGRSVRVIPLVGTIDTIGALGNGSITPFPQEVPGKRLVYHVVTSHARASAGATSLAISSSSRMMCACGMPGKKVRQIRWVVPYSSVKRRICAMHCSGPPMMKRSAMSRSRSVAMEASMN